MIWGLPKIHHAVFSMASGIPGRSLPLGWLRVDNDLIAQTIIFYSLIRCFGSYSGGFDSFVPQRNELPARPRS
jgi:hypothetical protein